MTAIDFAKEFLQTLYCFRDAEKAAKYPASDLIWVTADEILHLKSDKAVLDHIRQILADDPQPYNVDVASIKSAPVSDDTNVIALDVNLIPRREQDTMNVRCSFCVSRIGERMELTFIGMSRKYERSGQEQMRGFMENLPGGISVLAGFENGTFRQLYVNSYFSKKLGMDEDIFYDMADENPLFMIRGEDRLELSGMLRDAGEGRAHRSVTMQTYLETEDGREIPYQVSALAAYQEKNGTRTIWYLLFTDLTATLKEVEKKHREELDQAERNSLLNVDQRVRDLVERTIREKESAEALQEEAQDRIEEAARQVEDAGVLIQAAKAAAEQTEKTAAEQIRTAKEEAESSKEEAIRELTEKLTSEKEEAVSFEAAEKKKAEDRAQELELKLSGLRQDAQEKEEASQKLIEELRAEIKELTASYEASLAKEKEKLREETEERISVIEKKAQEREWELAKEADDARAEQEGNRQGYLLQIGRLKAQIEEKEEALENTAAQIKIFGKEKDKSVDRLSWLLRGQSSTAASFAEAAQKERDKNRQQAMLRKIAHGSDDLSVIIQDLKNLSQIDPTSRAPEDYTFTMTSCIGTVRKIVRPQCKEKEISFSCETDGTVPDKVVGNKTGLQLAFLSILENAVHATPRGGKIVLRAQADPPVHGRAYFHFTITDNGSGIADNILPTLFDNPLSELSIARREISAMGGSIQVRKSESGGAEFEVSVNLKIV